MPNAPRKLTAEQFAAREAKALATTTARGETLWFDEYTMTPTATFGVYAVTTPERIDKRTGEVYVIDYTVDVMGQTCNCWQFARGKGKPCKHLIGADKAVTEAQAAVIRATALLTPRADAAPARPKPAPMALPTAYRDRGATRWTPDCIPPATQAALARGAKTNSAADYD